MILTTLTGRHVQMNEFMSKEELMSKIESHELLVPGDVCIRKFDKERKPVIINYSYASEYYMICYYDDCCNSDQDRFNKSINNYNILIQMENGLWHTTSWVSREDLEYCGHIDSDRLYLLKIMSRLGIKDDQIAIDLLVKEQ